MSESPPGFTVIVPSHNPDAGRLQAVIAALRRQTLGTRAWELIIVDNHSSPPIAISELPANGRIVVEPRLGLTFARRCGMSHARFGWIVMVDDDNVLNPRFLEQAQIAVSAHPKLGVLGGPIAPVFDEPPAPWVEEFYPLLALRDLGPVPIISKLTRDERTGLPLYPEHAPVGAGMVVRREVAQRWMQDRDAAALTDRRGANLASSGDNDIVWQALEDAWEVGYFPTLGLEHLIPLSRCTRNYLGRLNFGIQQSWVQLLHRHHANPWPPIAPWSRPLRCARAWFRRKAWRNEAAYVRWRGDCGRFHALASLPRASSPSHSST